MPSPKIVCIGCGVEVGALSPMCDACTEQLKRAQGHLREHAAAPECWCQPYLDYVDPSTGVGVWVHRELQ